MSWLRDAAAELFKRDIEAQGPPSPWYVRTLTWPLSLILGVLVRCRHWLYDQGFLRRYSLPGVTISVGNIAVGGTGKSPMVIEVVRALTDVGARCAVVTRGYGSDLGAKGFMVLQSGQLLFPPQPSARMPDEARMQSVNLPDVPIIIGRDRWRAVTQALHSGVITPPTHWILDDGFQHRRLTRHLDIVLLDAEHPFGNTYLLPRGNLREPLTSLRRAGALYLTRARSRAVDQGILNEIRKHGWAPVIAVPFVSRLRPEAVGSRSVVFDPSKHAKVACVCGIARPQLFEAELCRQGFEVQSSYFVGDHCPFDRERIRRLAKDTDAIITTEKDYYRDPAIFADLDCPVFLVELCLDLDAGNLAKTLNQALSKAR
jgi:tetraacyldisaccharide 4'-kinase